MTPKGQHPATPGTPRVTTGHAARSIYQHNAPGTYARQLEEYLERCGLAQEVDDRAEAWEQDLQDDLDAERRLLPRFPRVLRLRRINTTDNEKKRAA